MRPSGSPLDHGIMGQADNRTVRSTQLDLDFGRFPEQPFEAFHQLGRLCIPERNLRDS